MPPFHSSKLCGVSGAMPFTRASLLKYVPAYRERPFCSETKQDISCGEVVGEFYIDLIHLEMRGADHSFDHVRCDESLACFVSSILFLYHKI